MVDGWQKVKILKGIICARLLYLAYFNRTIMFFYNNRKVCILKNHTIFFSLTKIELILPPLIANCTYCKNKFSLNLMTLFY